MTLCTLDDVRSYLQKPSTDHAQDALLTTLIAQASDAIRDYTQREWSQTAPGTSRTFSVWTDRERYVPFGKYELASAPAPTVVMHDGDAAEVTLAASDYSLEPVNATREGTYLGLMLSNSLSVCGTVQSAAFGYSVLRVTGTWGVAPASVPEPVKRACIVAVSRWFRRDSAGSINIASPAPDDFPVEQPESLPAASRALLSAYRRQVMA